MLSPTLTPTADDVRALRFGEAFEALFAGGEMRERPRNCSTCAAVVDETKAAYVVSIYPIARSYRIVGVYDRAACLPERLESWRDRWDGQAWLTIDEDTGAEILTHPLEVRELDPLDEAVLLLAEHQREDAELVALLRAYFQAEPDDLLGAEWGRLLDRTTLVFATGHALSLAQLLHAHRAHYAANEGQDAATPPLPTSQERLRCFIEESALTTEEA